MATKTVRRGRLPLAILCAFGLTSLVGCGGGVKRIPVSGTVTLDGQPLNGGVLVFSPDTAKGNTAQISCASPVREGQYELETVGVTGADSGKGVPPGWYKVILKTPNRSTKKRPDSPIEVNDKYKSVEKTPLSVEVKNNPEPGAYDFKLTK
jgi:hypothetical protein